MGARWYTSDPHFGHAKVAEIRGYGRTPLAVALHDDVIVRNWNAVVGKDDDVWITGDLTLRNPDAIWPVIDQLNGTRHLILGNHDRAWPGHRDAHKWQRRYLDHFASVQAFARHKIAGQDVLLSHFPYEGSGDHTDEERHVPYRFRDRDGWLIHGHVHGKWQQNGRQINVGMDAWRMRPVRLDKIEELIKAGPANLACPLTPMQAANLHTQLSQELELP